MSKQDRYCNTEAISITYLCVCVCVFARARIGEDMRVRGSVCVAARARAWARVILLVKHATRSRHIVCGLSGSTTYLDITS